MTCSQVKVPIVECEIAAQPHDRGERKLTLIGSVKLAETRLACTGVATCFRQCLQPPRDRVNFGRELAELSLKFAYPRSLVFSVPLW